MEKDDEIKGDGNSYDFGARFHDPRLGRFLSIDPRSSRFPSMSPYCYAGNIPTSFSDDNGEGPIIGWHLKSMNKDKENKVYTIEYDITITRDFRVVNMSTLNLTPEEGLLIAQNLANSWGAEDFSYLIAAGTPEAEAAEQMARIQYTHIPEDYQVQFKVNINFVVGNVAYQVMTPEAAKKIDTEETLIGIVDDVAGDNVFGQANQREMDAAVVEKDCISTKEIVSLNLNMKQYQTSVHETLHLDGADETYPKNSSGEPIGGGCGVMGTQSQNFSMCDATKKEIAVYNLTLARRAHSMYMNEDKLAAGFILTQNKNWYHDMAKSKASKLYGKFTYSPGEQTNGEALIDVSE